MQARRLPTRCFTPLRFATQSVLILVCATALVATPAMAEPKAVSVAKVDGQVRIAVAWSDGVVFFDADGTPYHKYSFKPGKKGGITLADANNDGAPDFIAQGKPTFLINADGEPVWSVDDCDDVAVANLAGESDLETFCRDGKTLRVIDATGFTMWELAISGAKLKKCQIGDVGDDGTLDIECQAGKKTWFLISGQGALIDDSATRGSGKVHSGPALPNADLVGDNAKKDGLFDFNGDGTSEEYLVVDGSDLVVQSKSSNSPLAATSTTGGLAAAVFDLDGDGADEVVVASDNRLVALDKDAEKTLLFDQSFNRKKLKRQATVDLVSVGTYGLSSDEDALRTALQPTTAALEKCYTKRVKKDPFLKSGRLSVRLPVDASGVATAAEKTFTTLNDEGVVKCVLKKLNGQQLAAPSGEGDAYAVVDFVFGYRDQ